MRMTAWIAFFLCAPVLAYAQIAEHCTHPESGPRASRLDLVAEPATADIEALFVSGHSEEGFVVIGNAVTGEQARLPLDPRIRYRADKTTRLSAQRNLTIADFQEGDHLKVRFRRTDGRVVELRLRATR